VWTSAILHAKKDDNISSLRAILIFRRSTGCAIYQKADETVGYGGHSAEELA
jgi:hypothetical protein